MIVDILRNLPIPYVSDSTSYILAYNQNVENFIDFFILFFDKSLGQNMANMTTNMTTFVVVKDIYNYMTVS